MEKRTSRVASLSKRSFKRLLGSFDLFAIGYGDIGSSIYYALGVVAFFSLGMTPISILLAGIVFICTALTYAELSATFPESGGSATFSRKAFNDLISFIAGWGLLLDYIVTIAISSFAVPPYLTYVFDYFNIMTLDQKAVQMSASIGVIVVLFFMNFFGVKKSTRFSLVLALFTIFTQLLIVIFAGYYILDIREVVQDIRIDGTPDWSGFIKGTAMAMVAYTGIESIAQLSGEAKKPEKVVPRAILMTIVTLLVLYIGISFVALSSVDPSLLGTEYINNPILAITSSLPFGSKILTPWVGLIAAMILFIAANAGLIGASRLSYSMGESYQIPRFFYRLHKKFRTPYIALLFFAILAIAVIVMSQGEMLFLADLYNFGAMLAFLSSHLALIYMRIKKPHIKRPFKAPLNIPFSKKVRIPLTAIIGAISTFAVWLLVVFTKPAGRYAGLGWILVGLVMYLFYRKKEKMKVGKVSIEKVYIPSFKELKYQKILVATRGGADTDTVQVASQLAKDYKAKLIALHIIDVPESMPFDVELPKKVKAGENALKRAEAIGREYGVSMQYQLVRSRSLAMAIYNIAKEEKVDLVIIGASKQKRLHAIDTITSKLKKTKAKVWILAR